MTAVAAMILNPPHLGSSSQPQPSSQPWYKKHRKGSSAQGYEDSHFTSVAIVPVPSASSSLADDIGAPLGRQTTSASSLSASSAAMSATERLLAQGFKRSEVEFNLRATDGNYREARDLLIHDAHQPRLFRKDKTGTKTTFKDDCPVCIRNKGGNVKKNLEENETKQRLAAATQLSLEIPTPFPVPHPAPAPAAAPIPIPGTRRDVGPPDAGPSRPRSSDVGKPSSVIGEHHAPRPASISGQHQQYTQYSPVINSSPLSSSYEPARSTLSEHSGGGGMSPCVPPSSSRSSIPPPVPSKSDSVQATKPTTKSRDYEAMLLAHLVDVETQMNVLQTKLQRDLDIVTGQRDALHALLSTQMTSGDLPDLVVRTAELAAAKAELARSQSVVDELRQQQEMSEDVLRKVETELGMANYSQQQLEAQAAADSRELAAAQREIQELMKAKQELTEAASAAAQSLAAAERATSSVAAQVKELAAEKARLTEQAAVHTSELGAAKVNVDSLEDKVRELALSNTTLRDQVQAALDRSNLLEKQQKRAREEDARIRAELQNMSNSFRPLFEERDAALAAQLTAQSELQDARSDVEKFRALLAEAQEANANVQPAAASKPECIVCNDSDATLASKSCGHLCLCNGCAKQVVSQHARCPVCRMPIPNMGALVRVYWSCD